jgi:hypothetical protein
MELEDQLITGTTSYSDRSDWIQNLTDMTHAADPTRKVALITGITGQVRLF